MGGDCLMAAPFVVKDSIVGFVGVEHPRRNTGDLLLLTIAASACYREISVRHLHLFQMFVITSEHPVMHRNG